jgi:hypothetical protein
VKRTRSFLASLFFLLGALLFASHAQAAGSSRLVYGRTAGADSCPSEVDLRAAVRERLGYDPFFPWAEQTIVVHIAPRSNRRVTGKVYLVDVQGRASPEREFTTGEAECQELVLALALAIVMTLDPLHGSIVAPPAPPVSTPPKAPATDGSAGDPAISMASGNASDGSNAPRNDASPVPVAPSTPPLGGRPAERVSTDPFAARAPTLQIGAAPFVASGVTPGISAGFIPSIRGRSGEISVSIEGRFEIPLWSSFDSDRADVSHVGAAVVPCWHWKRVTGCPTLMLGEFRAEGREGTSRRDVALFAAVGARTGAEVSIAPRSWAFVRAEVLVNLTRHQLVLAEEPIWKVPSVGFTLSAGALTSIL